MSLLKAGQSNYVRFNLFIVVWLLDCLTLRFLLWFCVCIGIEKRVDRALVMAMTRPRRLEGRRTWRGLAGL